MKIADQIRVFFYPPPKKTSGLPTPCKGEKAEIDSPPQSEVT